MTVLSSCGIDNFVYIEPVTAAGSPKLPRDAASSSQPSEWLFVFTPADNANSGNIYYRGSEIVYRIYKSYKTCDTDYNAISSYNENTSTQANIYTYLTGTKKFARLCIIHNPNVITAVNTTQPLFDDDSANPNRTIRIRFITYNNITEYPNDGIYVDSNLIGIPARSPDMVKSSVSSKTFYDFAESPDDSSDVDTTSKTADDDPADYWYISAWVLSYGVKEDYSPVYSKAAYLGTIPFEKGDDK